MHVYAIRTRTTCTTSVPSKDGHHIHKVAEVN